ncbi:G1/S-specific cyclin D [Handroanthus impetiginosus]|uniref:G1/S-specific cyclin D n=1 Tax=Handroanthus impetiginosus TaxID=429701 RepID=A0A2G9GCW1_9LAMI|nr:G1/S-specific cyclin D [Handroanthus impetiginosus]
MDVSQAIFSPYSPQQSKENQGSLDEVEMCGFSSTLEGGDEDEYVGMLLEREIKSCGLKLQEDWIIGARLDAIQYIFRERELLGFKFQTAYLSVTYLDRFLARRSIDVENSWAIRLLSMACLSLAAKMEECAVPALSEFCLDAYNFESRTIKRMELLVLNTLEWKMGPITPFSFIPLFMNKLTKKSLPRIGLSRILEAILGAVRDVKIMCQRPSVIAAAATLVASDQRLTREALELKIGLLSSKGVLKIEDVISCYYQLQNMEIERLKLEKGIESPDLSPVQLQRSEAYGSSSATYVDSAKRKRLLFNQSDMSDKKQKH